jgi:hypothetical protein
VLDATLSVQKYTALTLGDQWEVRLWQDRGQVSYRQPFALVLLVGDTANSGSAHYADLAQPMAVHCYPTPQESADASLIAALAVEDSLFSAFRMTGVGLGRPARVPLFDYSGVSDPTKEDSDVRWEHDFLRVTGFSTTRIPEPDDPRRVRVVASFTANWRRTAGRSLDAQLVEEIVLNGNGE